MSLRSRSAVFTVLVLAVLLAPARHASAATINDFNLAAFNFDVVTYNDGGGSGITGNATASGTSNGIAWSIGPTNIWTGRTVTNGTFSFAQLLPLRTDNLHVSSTFTVTFAQPIEALLVALSNDNNTGDAINFSVAPVDVRGNLAVNGTQVVQTTPAGGLVLFTNIKSLTVTHTDNNGQTDGFDFAFHAVPVPEPSSLLLVGTALVLGARRWRGRA